MKDFILSRVQAEIFETINSIEGSEQAEIAAKFLNIARKVAAEFRLPLGYVAHRLASTNKRLYQALYH